MKLTLQDLLSTASEVLFAQLQPKCQGRAGDAEAPNALESRLPRPRVSLK